MTLDERVRTGLHASAEARRIDEDRAFDDVLRARDRHAARARVMRQAGAAIVVAVIFASVAVLVSWRTTPDHYRSVTTVRAPNEASGAFMAQADPVKIANSPAVREQTLAKANVTSRASIMLHATSAYPQGIVLSATGSDRRDVEAAAAAWTRVVAASGQLNPKEAIRAQLRALVVRVTKLHRELRRIDHELAKVDPVTYGGVLRFDMPVSNLGGGPPAPPSVPEHGTVHELNLAFERIQIQSQLVDLGEQARALQTQLAQPELIPPAVTQAPVQEVAQTPPATVPALVALAIAVVVILGGALFVYRRRIRDSGRGI